ncbi:MAG: enoyl-CoA hydratase/isomerase family protein [Pararhodobacter sp.]
MKQVLLTQARGLATITLNRPERANALSDTLLADLHGALDALDAPRAVLLRAEGRHFCTGGDVARFATEVAAGNGKDYARRLVGGLNRAILRLAALPCPVLAQVQGALTGGALGLVLTADLVAMTPDAFIQPWYARVGFAPDGGWTALMPARIGPARARAVQLLNQRIPADEALALGLVQAVCDDVDARIAGWLAQLEGHVPGAMAATKALMCDLPALEAALEAERAAFVERIELAEVQEGMARFLAGLEGV